MVLRTNKDGYASTLDPSTIVWSVARAGQGDGYSNQMEDGGASLGFPRLILALQRTQVQRY